MNWRDCVSCSVFPGSCMPVETRWPVVNSASRASRFSCCNLSASLSRSSSLTCGVDFKATTNPIDKEPNEPSKNNILAIVVEGLRKNQYPRCGFAVLGVSGSWPG